MKDFQSDGKYIVPRTDSGFKILFGTEDTKDILIGFLNDLFDSNDIDPIEDVTFLDRERTPDKSIEKKSVYDIHCFTKCGKRFIVEMQNFPQAYFLDRSLFYAARAIVEQSKSGKWPYDYMPVYGVFICDFPIPGYEGEVRVDSGLMNKKSAELFSDKLNLTYIQLSEFKKTNTDECVNDFERWVYILKYLETMSTIPFAGMKEAFKRVENVGRVENLRGEALRRYEHDLKAYRDYHAQMQYAQTVSRAEGKAEGRAEGKAEVIRTLVSSGMSTIQISEMLHIPEADIKQMLQ